MENDSLAGELAQMAERLHRAPDSEQTAEEVVAFAREQLDADFAGISLFSSRGQLQTVAPTHPVVEQADHLQYQLGEGPCHDSALRGAAMVSQDLTADSRWPLWAPSAVALGISSALGVELLDRSGDRRLGALNLYWAQPRIFTSDEVGLAHLIARHAALALNSTLTEEGLNTALDGRKRIGQAQGILMERHGLTEDQAFSVLKRYSQDHNIKLRVLADMLVETKRLPEATSRSLLA